MHAIFGITFIVLCFGLVVWGSAAGFGGAGAALENWLQERSARRAAKAKQQKGEL
jgi:hypothetical protein